MRRTSRVYYPKTYNGSWAVWNSHQSGVLFQGQKYPKDEMLPCVYGHLSPQQREAPWSGQAVGTGCPPSLYEMFYYNIQLCSCSGRSVSKLPFLRSSTYTLTLLLSSAGAETTLACLQPHLCRLLLGAPKPGGSVNSHQWPFPKIASDKKQRF